MGYSFELRKRMLQLPGVKASDVVGAFSSIAREQRTDVKSRDIVVVATTNDIDLDREVVVPSGANTEYFSNNGSVFVDHCYSLPFCIGKLRNKPKAITDSSGVVCGWLCRFHVYDGAKNPLADDVWTMANQGGISVSIGFRATDFGDTSPSEKIMYSKGGVSPRSIVRKWDWLELSVTQFPCNVMARQIGIETEDDDEVPIMTDSVKSRIACAQKLGCDGKLSMIGKIVVGEANRHDSETELKHKVRKRIVIL